jgi:Mg2+/Co2+ transporter CorB
LLCRLFRRQLAVTDITGDDQLESEYHLRIPVLRDEQGEVLAEGVLDWKQIYRAVRSA